MKELNKCCLKCFDEGVSQLSYGGCNDTSCKCHKNQAPVLEEDSIDKCRMDWVEDGVLGCTFNHKDGEICLDDYCKDCHKLGKECKCYEEPMEEEEKGELAKFGEMLAKNPLTNSCTQEDEGTPNTQEPIEWEEKYCSEFYFLDREDGLYGDLYKDIKSFLKSQIKQAEEKERERFINAQKSCDSFVEVYIQPYVDKKVEEERERIVKEIRENWEISIDKDLGTSHSLAPLEDIINIITNQ